MKFSGTDKMLQLGVVPTLAGLIEERYPNVSASVWQRKAKTIQRDLMDGIAEPEGDSVFAQELHAMLGLAALLLAFDMAAPAGIEPTGEDFDRMVKTTLSAPIVQMTFGTGGDLFSEAGIREITQFLKRDASAVRPGSWRGELRREGDAGSPGEALVCTLTQCGLAQLCLLAERPYLLKYLCPLEIYVLESNDVLVHATCGIATGSSCCELRCVRI